VDMITTSIKKININFMTFFYDMIKLLKGKKY